MASDFNFDPEELARQVQGVDESLFDPEALAAEVAPDAGLGPIPTGNVLDPLIENVGDTLRPQPGIESGLGQAAATAARVPGQLLDVLSLFGGQPLDRPPPRALLHAATRDLPEDQQAEARRLGGQKGPAFAESDVFREMAQRDPEGAQLLLQQLESLPAEERLTFEAATIQLLRNQGIRAGEGEERTASGMTGDALAGSLLFGGPGRVLAAGKKGLGLIARGKALLPRQPVQEIASIGGEVLGRQATQDSGALAEAGGGVVGAVVPAVGLSALSRTGRAIGGLGPGVKAAIKGEASEATKLDKAAQRVQEGLDRDVALAEFDRVQKLAAETPGFEPTFGAAAGQPSLMTLEDDLIRHRAGEGPTLYDFELIRAEGDEAAVLDLLDLGPRDPESALERSQIGIRAYVDGRIAEVVAEESANLRDVEGKLRALAPEQSADLAKRVRERLEIEEAEVFNVLGKEFDAVAEEAALRGVEIPGIQVRQALIEIDKRAGKAILPPNIKEQASAIANERFVSYRQLRDLEVDLGDALDAADNAGQKRLVGQLAALKEATRDAMDNMGLDQLAQADMTPIQKRAWTISRGKPAPTDLARRHMEVKAQHRAAAERFRDGEGGALFASTRGVRNLSVEETLDGFLKPGSKGASTVRAARKTFGEGSDSMVDFEQYIVDKAVSGIIDEKGIIRSTQATRKAHRAFMAKYGPAIDAMPPSLRKKLESVEALAKQTEALGEAGQKIARDKLMMGRLQVFIDDPRGGIQKIFNLPNARSQVSGMAEFKRAVGTDPLAQEGLRAAVWGHLLAGEGVIRVTAKGRSLNPDRLKARLEKMRPVLLAAGFDSGHLKNLDRVVDIADINRRIPTGGPTRGVPDPKGLIEQLPSSGLFNQLLGTESRALRANVLFQKVNKVLGKHGAELLIREAATNPEYARRLLTHVLPNRDRNALKWLSANSKSTVLRTMFDDVLAEDREGSNNPRNIGVAGQ